MADDPGAEPGDLRLPRGVALAWGVAANPQRGPKRELSIEKIVDTAVELADAEGLAAVSMSRVAQTLGFTTMSLYRYVTSKDDLLVLMEDRAADHPIPAEDDLLPWREGVRRWARAVRSMYHAHPWLSQIPITGAPMTPSSLAAADWLLRELRPVALPTGEKMATLLLVSSYTRSMASIDADMARASASARDDAVAPTALQAALVEFVSPERFPDLSPVIIDGDYVGSDTGMPDEDFEYGLARILDGIEARIAAFEAAGGLPAEPVAAPAPAVVDDAAVLKDRDVREAARARREAEKALRDRRKEERQALRAARARLR